MPLNSPVINVMVTAARKAARKLARDFGEVENLQVSRKGPGDFVSAADLRAEKIIFEELSKARPGYGFLMEESGAVEGPDKTHRWIIDPLDGTTNFLHGIPHFAISIALERDGQLVNGVIYNPVTDDLFVTEKGNGAYLNDRRLRVAARTRLDEAVFATGIPFKGLDWHAKFTREIDHIMPQVAGIRRFGAASLDLAWVAAGRFDGYWEHGLQPWDIAAGVLMVKEAGGFVSDINGADKKMDTNGIIAANADLLPHLQAMIKKAGRAAG
ncbi:inositol monophosphatase family protein [Pyruvatibacter mobilis]|uniref:inositol monophosphatase family protein n=1 Tax=Pyruvatibacter mobilis TaxID=1712261 RepID=UPI000407A5A9